MLLSKALRARSGQAIAFTGAGGKTTTIHRLVQEVVSGSFEGISSTLITTTTRMGQEQSGLANQHLIDPLENEVYKALVDHKAVLVTGPDLEGKWIPPSEQLLPVLHRITRETGALLLIEADGARGRSLKAPANHEPVIPSFIDLVVPMAGMDALGQRIDSEAVHRPELVAAVSKKRQKTVIGPRELAGVLGSEAGGLKGVLENVEVRVLLNKAEDTLLESGAQAAQILLENSRISSVVLSSVIAEDPVREVHGRISGVILAAGGSARLGEPKQFVQWRGHPLVWHAAGAAAGLDRTVVVVGESIDQMQRALKGQSVEIIENPDWETGQSSSVRLGLEAASRGAEGVVFLLADMPFVNSDLVRALVDRHRQTLSPLVAAWAGGRRANPVLFDRQTFDDLRSLSGDQGGRAIFRRFEREFVQWDEEILLDVDNAEDLERLRELE